MRREPIKVSSIFGDIWLPRDDLITSHVQKFGAHTRTELAFLLSVINPGDTMFDLGCHCGTFSIPAAKKLGPAGKMLCVDGLPSHIALLKKNARFHGVSDRLNAINKVVKSEQGNFRAQTQDGNSGATRFIESREGIDSISIHELVKTFFMPSVIKMDLEGDDYSVLINTSWSELDYPILFFEVLLRTMDNPIADLAKIEDALHGRNYRLFWNQNKSHAQNDEFTPVEIKSLQSIGKQQFNIMALPEGRSIRQ